MTAASFSASNAYIADVTPPAKRGGAYGMIGAAFGIGFVAGPALGCLLSHYGTRAPFFGAAALAVCNFCYGLFVLPESLAPELRSKAFDWRSATPLRAVLNLRRYPQVFGLAIVALLFNTAHYVLPATFVLYADYRYHWGEQTVGYVLAAVGICGAVVQAGLAGRVVKRLGERRTLLLGCVFGTLGFAIYGFAPTGPWFLAGIPVMAFWGLASPATQALMSRQVDATEQGRLQGAVTGLTSLAGIFAPFLFASLFAAVIRPQAVLHLPGASFLLSSLIVVAAGVVAWRVTAARSPAAG
jgi:DHA1 family tetracycline resistance protein-like MFS transporter